MGRRRRQSAVPRTAFAKAAAAGDVGEVLAFYAEDAVMVPPGEAVATGNWKAVVDTNNSDLPEKTAQKTKKSKR